MQAYERLQLQNAPHGYVEPRLAEPSVLEGPLKMLEILLGLGEENHVVAGVDGEGHDLGTRPPRRDSAHA